MVDSYDIKAIWLRQGSIYNKDSNNQSITIRESSLEGLQILTYISLSETAT